MLYLYSLEFITVKVTRSIHAGVTIGFELEEYTVNEGDGVLTVAIVAFAGRLSRSVTVRVTSEDISAEGLKHLQY